MSSNYLPVREEWLQRGQEQAIEPALPIVDAHHHFYDRPGWTYLHADYAADARSGHAVQASVYMQALTRYRADGPEALRPVGETAFVVASTAGALAPEVAKGIVGYADLRLGAGVAAVLDAHAQAGRGRFRGVRHLTTWDADGSLANPLTAAPPGLLRDAAYRAGLAQLQAQGLSYDAWLFWPQLPELVEVAAAFPALPIIVDHCGGVVRIGAHAAHRDEVFARWKASMQALARFPNVHVKLGGLGMRINGFGFEQGDLPPTSEALAAAWKPWMLTCIEAFGAGRCMFESNFPVDKGTCSYPVLWNAFKRIATGMSKEDKAMLFAGTAARVYRLG